MKRTFFKRNLRSIVATVILLCGLFLSVNRAEAQSYNWVSESIATTKVAEQLDQLSLDIQNFVPGSTPYKNMENQIAYYKLIAVALEDGLPTGTAVSESLPKVNDRFNSTKDFVTKVKLQELFDGAVVLLTI
ncbi:MAG: hypothetical protein JNJ57_11215 [Saprospiraceae bacterium]|nr:hypothetical protein [Saprospiraceae bacterium]